MATVSVVVEICDACGSEYATQSGPRANRLVIVDPASGEASELDMCADCATPLRALAAKGRRKSRTGLMRAMPRQIKPERPPRLVTKIIPRPSPAHQVAPADPEEYEDLDPDSPLATARGVAVQVDIPEPPYKPFTASGLAPAGFTVTFND